MKSIIKSRLNADENDNEKGNASFTASKIIKILIILILIISVITLIVEYRINEEFREFFDIKILRKEISDENTVKIDIDGKSNQAVYAYNNYVTILDRNTLSIYTGSSKPDYTLDVNISNPIYSSNDRFLCIAENTGTKAYLINGQNIVWQKDVEGEIRKVNVNKNGYVAIVTSNTEYTTEKSVITTYNSNGVEMFKTWLPTTYAVDVEISNDNKYMAIAEIATSGTNIQSDIKIVSFENAMKSPDNAFIKIYDSNNKSLIANIKYQSKNQIICFYDDKIVKMLDDVTELVTMESNTNFADIELDDYIVLIKKQVSGILKTEYIANIININTLEIKEYKLNGVPKNMQCKGDLIAINYGNEIEVINTNAWLVKRYKSSLQEVNMVSLGNSIVAVRYKDKIEIINL